MSYLVHLSTETEKNRDQAYQYYLERSPQGAHRWFTSYEKAIFALISDPHRYAVARENDNFSAKLQQINFGTKLSRPTHRLIFYVEERTVYVVTLRHLHQQDWQPQGPLT
ncbi:MAG: hypothetical protein GXP24_12275 [Planctomycetes bacterium]|nr:hypothetical protein [Planctomycetota bacterium]